VRVHVDLATQAAVVVLMLPKPPIEVNPAHQWLQAKRPSPKASPPYNGTDLCHADGTMCDG